MRTLLAIGALLALILAACSTNSGSSASPTPTEPMMMATPSLDTMASPDASPVAMTCDDAFASLSASDLASISSLSDAQGVLDTTIAACPTSADWATAAQTVLPTVDLTGAVDFLRQRCAANQQLTATRICAAITS